MSILPQIRHNLPTQPTSFIGREDEIAEITALLADPACRLLTLVGLGGIGKTRLAIEAAARRTDTFSHGIFFVPLATLNAPADIVSTVIHVLGIYTGDEGTPREELVTFLSQRHLLLIMDNFEHLLDGADLLSDILQAAPNVKVLATSREVLNLEEEWVWHVQGMRFPENTAIDDIEPYGALKLFIDRAQRVRRDFSTADEQVCAIHICQLVAGMPLALELAASWAKTLICAEIAAEIQRSSDFLATNIRNVPERHRSMRTVFDHSWRLCGEREQTVFRKLSLFRGGFEREAAEQIAGASLLTLSALVEKSMLRKLPSGRYEVHELLRQYAEEKLETAGELAAMEVAHTQYYADFMQARTPDIKGRRQLAGLNEIEADFENVRSAWNRAVERADYEALDRMVEGLALFCDMRARYQRGQDMLQRAVKHLAPGADENVHPVWNRLRARWLQVWILSERSPVPEHIREQLEAGLILARDQGDATTAALCLWSTGELDRIDEDYGNAIYAYQNALAHYSDLSDEYYVVRVLRGMLVCYFGGGYDDREEAIDLNRQHLNLAREIGDRTGMAHAVLYAGVIAAFITGNPVDRGEGHYHQALEIWQEMGDRKSIGVVLEFLSWLAWLKGELESARRLLAEGIQICEDVNFQAPHRIIPLQGLVAVLEAKYVRARQLCEEGGRAFPLAFMAQLGLSMTSMGTGDFQHARAHFQNMLNTSRFPLVDQIFIPPVAAALLAHESEYVRAAELLGLAFAQPKTISGWMHRWPVLTQLRANLEAELGTEAYQAAWARGTQLDFGSTVAQLREYFGTEPVDAPQLVSQPLAVPLTSRELEVLALLVEGLSNREIADKLYLSVGTVKVHTRNIYGKMGVNNRTQAAAIARERNLM